jgi:hypothetical protein
LYNVTLLRSPVITGQLVFFLILILFLLVWLVILFRLL